MGEMPTNVTPEFRKAEEAYRTAQTTDEKIERLEEMISVLPKHKGTDHLYADLKKRLSKLRAQVDSSEKRAGRGSNVGFSKEGAGQIVLVGPPNCGKSTLLSVMSHAHPEIADYPFTTNRFVPGMIPYLDIQIQVVDTPPVAPGHMPGHLLGLVRGADSVLIVADLSSDSIIEDHECVISAFADRHVHFVREPEPGDRDAVKCRIAANKRDAPEATDGLGLLSEMTGNQLDIMPLSCKNPVDVSSLPALLFGWLGIVRVYTKSPGQKADRTHPYTVVSGQTVADICNLVHRDFSENLKSARLWRGSSEPIAVSRDEIVQDLDVVELHL